MRKHLYRKSAWKEGVPRSLNYRSVLSGALYGSRRVGGLTAHSSLRRPSRHRLRWSFLTFPSPGRPRGRRAPPLRDLPRCPPRRPSPWQPGCRRGRGGGGLPALGRRPSPGCGRSTCGPRGLTLAWRRRSGDGERPRAPSSQAGKRPPPPPPARHLQGRQGPPEGSPSRARHRGSQHRPAPAPSRVLRWVCKRTPPPGVTASGGSRRSPGCRGFGPVGGGQEREE